MKYMYGFVPYSSIEFLASRLKDVEKYAFENLEIRYEGEDENGNTTYGTEFEIQRYPIGHDLTNVQDNIFYEVKMDKGGKILSYKKHINYD